jgi:uncharacterized protein
MTSVDDQMWSHPSPGLWSMRKAQLGVATALVSITLFAVFGAAISIAAGAASAAVGVVAGILSTSFVRRRYQAWRYQERHEDLIVGRGVLVQRLSVVPYGRMQFVEVTAGPVERVFHLSTVKLHTAAAASDARIPGLHPDEAARLRDRLTALGESNAAGM